MQRYHRIRRVFYPGLPDFPGHNVAMAQMRGYGGMLTMEVDGPDGITLRIVNQLKLFAIESGDPARDHFTSWPQFRRT
jgi:cystathionine gamma-synthase